MKAIEMIQGACTDQYTHLRNYVVELVRSNHESTVIIKRTMGVHGPLFERIYVCFSATKNAFASTCRPLIGLDRCFLKELYGGQLLSVVGRMETTKCFPLLLLLWRLKPKNLGGLVHTLQDLYEMWSTRFVSSISTGTLGRGTLVQILRLLCGVLLGQAPFQNGKKAIDALKLLNEDAWKKMMELPPKMWSGAHFSTDTCCDLQVNNMCEPFNRVILEHRKKPIISLLEGLKFNLNNRIVKQRDLMLRWRNGICPIMQQKLELSTKYSDKWCAIWCGNGHVTFFEACWDSDKYVVDLERRFCACRRWDLTGIPCSHAVACMWFANRAPEGFVDNAYRYCIIVLLLHHSSYNMSIMHAIY
ncbi:uncharacterized protein LOC130719432 [Lotus japonicus]|uniref:uncharacterized protein LOC130719432 n=1 Tax=Lotus japonicus TaxID=34305 RepID=UPI00258A78D5|nr:uncharacterized protein LOC130719432 [Lotus japonicus]